MSRDTTSFQLIEWGWRVSCRLSCLDCYWSFCAIQVRMYRVRVAYPRQLTPYFTAGSVTTYRPVVVLHGILASDTAMEEFVQYIQTAHPGTQVLNVDAYNDLVSRLPLRLMAGICPDRLT